MKLPSGDCSIYLAMVGSGGQPLVDQENNRRGKPCGSNSGKIEVVGGGGCARLENLRRIGRGGSNCGIIEVIEGGDCARLKKLRRVGGGGGVGGSNNNCSREGDNNVDKNIVIKTTERDSRNICSLRSAQDGYVLANNPKSQNTLGVLSIGMSSSQPVCSMNVRWIQDPLFPRAVPLFQHLSSFTRNVDIARNGMVEGCLLSNQSTLLTLIGIIVKELCDWIPVLDFVPLTSLWIWVLDSRWRIICKRLFPSYNFIDGADTSLPTVDILLINGISLHICSITLNSVPFSLLLTTI